ncbi:ester cyclase [Flavisolibacter tropicus]|uniref:Polyketide cyclase n=1 Tax=Flavisolibacter tropicus TaxID=1492898 RepID=A0A172U1K7_9BACT|nr:ester cyclase [Flavisolibacter tropicus]ANE53068.1 polyketide cyclase [Flavisolibacter tropicus]
MKKEKTVAKVFEVSIGFVTLLACTGCSNNRTDNTSATTDSNRMNKPASTAGVNDETVVKNLAKFDTLDYIVFSRRDWDRFHESHSPNIKVYFPDGHMTKGFDVHIKDMDAMFVYAPDTRITAHPIKIGSGNITAVTGVMEGTFTKPMPMGNGKFIQPAGKAFKIPMSSFGVWQNGVMVEEYLYWDNKTYMQQMGIGQ